MIDTKVTCPGCDRKFNSIETMTNHGRSIHWWNEKAIDAMRKEHNLNKVTYATSTPTQCKVALEEAREERDREKSRPWTNEEILIALTDVSLGWPKETKEKVLNVFKNQERIVKSLKKCAFTIETVAHMQGREAMLLPVSDEARDIIKILEG